jgi:hypothetical protein
MTERRKIMKFTTTKTRIAALRAVGNTEEQATSIIQNQDHIRNSSHIFRGIWNAMQQAEEIGGPGGQAYIDLMNFISIEAAERANNAAMGFGIATGELSSILDLVQRYNALPDEQKGDIDQEIANSKFSVEFRSDWEDMSLSRGLEITKYCIKLTEDEGFDSCSLRIVGETNGTVSECGSPQTATLQTKASGSVNWFDVDVNEAQQDALLEFAAFHVYS